MIASNIPSLRVQINQFTCHIGLSLYSFKLKLESVLIPGLGRVLLDHLIVPMRHRLLLSVRNQARYDYASISARSKRNYHS